MMKKCGENQTMRRKFPHAKRYELIRECIARGVSYGWMRAHKHDQKPSEDHIKAEIDQAVLNELCEWFEL